MGCTEGQGVKYTANKFSEGARQWWRVNRNFFAMELGSDEDLIQERVLLGVLEELVELAKDDTLRVTVQENRDICVINVTSCILGDADWGKEVVLRMW
jgi:hypothetical protein